MSVRVRPSAPLASRYAELIIPSGVVVTQGTLNPLSQVRTLAREPDYSSLCPGHLVSDMSSSAGWILFWAVSTDIIITVRSRMFLGSSMVEQAAVNR